MPHLFWDPISINMLIEIILASAISIYFSVRLFSSWRTTRINRTDLFLFVTFAGATAGILLQFLPYSVHPFYANFAMPWISVPAVISMAGFVLFAFNFQREQSAWSSGNLCLGTLFLIHIGFEIYVAVARHELLQMGMVEYREAWISIPIGLGFFAAHIFFIERLIAALAIEKQKSWVGSIVPAVYALIWPLIRLSQDAAAARAFFYMASMPLVIGLTLVFQTLGLIDWRLAEILNCWFFLFTLAGFALVYLNYIPERSSFKIKLVGLTLTTVLTLISGTAWLVGSVYMEAYEYKHRLAEKTAIRFQLEKNGSYGVARTPYHFDMDIGERVLTGTAPVQLPFNFPFFGKKYSVVYPHRAGIVGFDQPPLWRNILHQFGAQPTLFLVAADLQELEKPMDKTVAEGGQVEDAQSGMFINKGASQATITWLNVASVHTPEDKYSFQLRLYPNGMIDMIFADLPAKPSTDLLRANATPLITGIIPAFADRQVNDIRFETGLPYNAAPGEGIIEYKRTDFLDYLDKIYEPIAQFVLAATLAVLTVFPHFFNVSLDRPLRKLIQSVRKILDGKLATPIEISYRDEIGYLASSFNEMALAQSDLIQTLEDKVAKRTAEVGEYADKNARLEERNHLSNELHDAVSQSLFSANLIADMVPTLLNKDPDRAMQALNDLKKLNKDALAEMRFLLLEWRSQKFSAYSFKDLLEEAIIEAERSGTLSIVLEIDTVVIAPDDIQHAFFRIAQEFLNNIVKHAAAANVQIRFDCQPSQVSLLISDDGCGFSMDCVGTGNLGLQIMKERMAKIGGKFEVMSEVGKGTVVTASWASDEAR